MLVKLFLGLCAVGMCFAPSDGIFFQSESLLRTHLTLLTGEFSMLDDEGERASVQAFQDEHGIIYWHRRLKTAVCQTGECKMVDVGIYWDCAGDFFGLEVYGEHLTKTDHSVFHQEDYDKLINILSNDWSILREYEFADLTVEVQDSTVDAASGATKTEIASQAVEHAVYTTYTLWHLIHNGEKEQIINLTTRRLDDNFIQALVASGESKHQHFLLDIVASGQIAATKPVQALILKGVQASEDPYLQDLALKSLSSVRLNDVTFQSGIASIYEDSSPRLKLRIVTALKDLPQVYAPLYEVIIKDLKPDDPWLAARILPLLSKGPSPGDAVMNIVRQLSKSTNIHVQSAAQKLLKEFNYNE